MSVNQFQSWEEAVEWIVLQPEHEKLVYACYFDRPVIEAAKRFWLSEEWAETRNLLPREVGQVLDVGAGVGIASFALAQDQWNVTALEPNPSLTAGCGAIKTLVYEAKLDIKIVQEYGESLPFEDATFDLVYARQSMHHATDLNNFCQEIFRVLKPGGIFIAVRDHVISSQNQLSIFLEKHPLHKFYGGENAFTLEQYKNALKNSNFRVKKIIFPFDSVINYAPYTKADLRKILKKHIMKFPGGIIVAHLLFETIFFDWILKVLSFMDRRPGRPFSFVAQKLRN